MFVCLQVVLSFYEKRVRQQWGLAFGKQEERLFWEQWCVRCAGFRVKAGSACALPGLPCSSGTSCACLMSMLWEQWCVRIPRLHRSSTSQPVRLHSRSRASVHGKLSSHKCCAFPVTG